VAARRAETTPVPLGFNSFDIKTNAPTVIMPILIAFGKVTDADDLAAVRAQLPAMSTQRKQLVVLDEGHTGADASDGAGEYARCIDLSISTPRASGIEHCLARR
jgi:hypothetical protein